MNKFIKSLPKIELHDHLDGGLRTDIIFEKLAKSELDYQISSPEDIANFINANLEKGSLAAYLESFKLTTSVMQTRDNIKRIAYEAAEDLAKENVIYAELRFAPELHTKKNLSLQEIIDAVREGLVEAEKDYEILTNIIICLMRTSDENMARQIAELCIENYGKKVCGFDIAGKELGFPPEKFVEIFDLLREKNVPITIHAGEEADYTYINSAILNCHARRIGHGIKSVDVADRYCLDIIKEHNVHLEVCLSSNIHTQAVSVLKAHPAKVLKEKNVNFSLCCDNRLVSQTNLTKELGLACEVLGFDKRDLLKMQKLAVENSFASLAEKAFLMEKIKAFEDNQ